MSITLVTTIVRSSHTGSRHYLPLSKPAFTLIVGQQHGFRLEFLTKSSKIEIQMDVIQSHTFISVRIIWDILFPTYLQVTLLSHLSNDRPAGRSSHLSSHSSSKYDGLLSLHIHAVIQSLMRVWYRCTAESPYPGEQFVYSVEVATAVKTR